MKLPEKYKGIDMGKGIKQFSGYETIINSLIDYLAEKEKSINGICPTCHADLPPKANPEEKKCTYPHSKNTQCIDCEYVPISPLDILRKKVAEEFSFLEEMKEGLTERGYGHLDTYKKVLSLIDEQLSANRDTK